MGISRFLNTDEKHSLTRVFVSPAPLYFVFSPPPVLVTKRSKSSTRSGLIHDPPHRIVSPAALSAPAIDAVILAQSIRFSRSSFLA